MSINSIDFFNAAKQYSSMADEASWRSAISRAYYSMYHETMVSLTCVPKYTSNHHGNLIGYMTTPAECKGEPYDSRTMRLLGYNLKQLRDARNEADYHIADISVSKEMADTAIASAELYFSKWTALKSAKAS
ncbi:hypothetical protein LH671_16590 [Enterobacter kobei]|jgi:uncharacterized protein (UPF0332 family)|nr:hypothetical protein [Enterobacter kobei]WGZ50152.1 hypothetical protein MOG78_22515 [Enterobacter hormaechei]DAY61505.1 MAG TPA: hypothetical protein [Caudoviricetes sp.]MCF1329536.1 hypothetical protein [Enterobacter kobei]MCK6998817.1 hypothetical protein [Enterobacter kobei]MEA3827045.1 hypothetical protein [Enterobacter kobei]